MARTVGQAQEEGHLRPDTDPEQLVFEVYNLMIGLMHDARFLRDPRARKRVQAAYERLIPHIAAQVHRTVVATDTGMGLYCFRIISHDRAKF